MINTFYYIVLLIMTAMGAVAALFLKKASKFTDLKELILNKNLYIGAIIYVISALSNIYILQYLNYSIVLPLTSITYIWTMILSSYVFKEKITLKKLFGGGFICVGSIFMII